MKDSDDMGRFGSDLVQLARLALTGRPQDVQLLVRRLARHYRPVMPEVAEKLDSLLRELPTRSSPLRKQKVAAIPVDADSRLQLVRWETVTELDVEPVFSEGVQSRLTQLVTERQNYDRLLRAGLAPTRTTLFTGAPGVGKTLAARWLARELQLPLLILDLSAVMSSFLGRTGNNVRHVLDYAKSIDCILLLDEFDAVAKRRDDTTEVGELKRLVTVLLQEIDDWPGGALLLAATNHSELLDPAVWRRFEMRVDFPMPDGLAVRVAVERFLGPIAVAAPHWVDILTYAHQGASFSEIERDIMQARRGAALAEDGNEGHFASLVRSRLNSLSRPDKANIAVELVRSGVVSQRLAHEITGVSRDTIRKAMVAGSTSIGNV